MTRREQLEAQQNQWESLIWFVCGGDEYKQQEEMVSDFPQSFRQYYTVADMEKFYAEKPF